MIARLRPQRRTDDGASAVEFALVLPILAALIIGIIDYGLWFSDSISMRQGVREAARQGIVQNFDGGLTSCSSGSDGQQLACFAKAQIGGITGDERIKIVAPSDWAKGEPLIVCAQMKSDAITGIIPLPRNEVIFAKVEMGVENTDFVVNNVSFEDSPVDGGEWSWCA